MPLCDSCQRFDIQKFATAPYRTQGFKLAHVERAAEQEGCEFCRFICRALQDAREAWKQPQMTTAIWVHLRMSKDNDWRSSDARPLQSGLQFNRLDLYICPRHVMMTDNSVDDLDMIQGAVTCRVLADQASSAAINGDVCGTYLGDDPASDSHFDAISKWLVTCLDHPKCCENASGTVQFDATSVLLPTRCIEVGQNTVKLKTTAGERGSYVTLTHRWRDSTQHSSTTVTNLQQRMEFIEPATLPQTFQDAMFVTRRLGIPYLWIDSLCILQQGDHGRDWKLEALKMSQYYQYSILTIAPSTSLPSGFLAPRAKSPEGEMVRLPYRDRNGKYNGSFYLQQRQGSLHSEYLVSVERGELVSRGWVLQEWLLSRRIIHYTATQMFFECQTSDPRNEFNEGIDAGGFVSQRFNLHSLGIESLGLKRLFSQKNASTRELWRRIVQAYSVRPLTNPKEDRILALSGLAKEVRLMNSISPESEEQEMYTAGWWLRDIHNGLLWEHLEDKIPTWSFCDAPTWSWAVWSSMVHWRHRDNELQSAIKVIEAMPKEQEAASSPEAAGPANNPFDVDNSYASLTLRGRLGMILVGPKLRESEQTMLAQFTGVNPAHMSRWRAVSSPDRPDIHIGWADVEHAVSQKEEASMEFKQVFLALHVSTNPKVAGGLEFGSLGLTHEVYCVLLITPDKSIGDDRPGQYLRAGTGRIFKKNFFQEAEEVEMKLV